MDEKPLSESDATSRKPGSCRETGEEFFAKHPFPLGDQMEQLPRATQQSLTLRTAELLRRHGAGKAMTGGGGATLLDQLATLGQRGGMAAAVGKNAGAACCICCMIPGRARETMLLAATAQKYTIDHSRARSCNRSSPAPR